MMCAEAEVSMKLQKEKNKTALNALFTVRKPHSGSYEFMSP